MTLDEARKVKEEAKRMLLGFAHDLEAIAEDDNPTEHQIRHADCKADAIIAKIENKKFFKRLS